MNAHYQFSVKWGDTDPAGIVFYPNYYKWMDEATHHLFSELGLPASQLLREQKVILPILRAECNFDAPAFFENQIEIFSSFIEVKNKVFQIEHGFYCQQNRIVSGFELRAWATLVNDKPKAVQIPEDVKKLMGRQQDPAQS